MLRTPWNLPEGRWIWAAMKAGVGQLKRTDPILDAGDGVDLEGDAGGFTGDEIRKRNLSFQVGFWPPNRSIAVLSLAEESTQVRA
jgi:hypothetical protein